ncbi:MAG: alanine--tRNA ligase, partial [Alphaproteobacteria bacterium]|nr:alanine--tRNA ligase [Alphaproteobacteria bacterium]
IRENYHVSTVLMNKEDAVNSGAMALFGEKYGDEVRVVKMEKNGLIYSEELCGGTHVCDTGDIGYFHILSESAIGAGLRRLECVTGAAAEDFEHRLEDKLHHISSMLKTNINDLEQRINNLMDDKKKLEQTILDLKKSMLTGQTSNDNDVQTINGVKFVGKMVPDAHPKELKSFADEISQSIKSGVIALASDKDGKASIVVCVTPDLVGKYNAVDLVKAAALAVGGTGGGGRPEMAQAGGNDVSKIADALEKIKAML